MVIKNGKVGGYSFEECLIDDLIFHAQGLSDFGNGLRVVPDTQCVVMSRSGHHPALDEVLGRWFKMSPRIGVTGRGDEAFFGLSLRNEELELLVFCHSDSEHGDGAFFDVELDRSTRTHFSMIFF